ncbi:phosphotransferase-like protein [Streptomyces pseudogriseolus]|uniref:phosphotransferase-like protein n=1 Tax=Streptomyces pseudogriseolus TaxID=36817 RepID=UPI003FA22702
MRTAWTRQVVLRRWDPAILGGFPVPAVASGSPHQGSRHPCHRSGRARGHPHHRTDRPQPRSCRRRTSARLRFRGELEVTVTPTRNTPTAGIGHLPVLSVGVRCEATGRWPRVGPVRPTAGTVVTRVNLVHRGVTYDPQVDTTRAEAMERARSPPQGLDETDDAGLPQFPSTGQPPAAPTRFTWCERHTNGTGTMAGT